MKVTISVDDALMERIDNYADENYMSRSGFITFACNEYLKQQDMVCLLRQIGNTMNLIAEKGEVDAEAQKQLDELQLVISVIFGNEN